MNQYTSGRQNVKFYHIARHPGDWLSRRRDVDCKTTSGNIQHFSQKQKKSNKINPLFHLLLNRTLNAFLFTKGFRFSLSCVKCFICSAYQKGDKEKKKNVSENNMIVSTWMAPDEKKRKSNNMVDAFRNQIVTDAWRHKRRDLMFLHTQNETNYLNKERKNMKMKKNMWTLEIFLHSIFFTLNKVKCWPKNFRPGFHQHIKRMKTVLGELSPEVESIEDWNILISSAVTNKNNDQMKVITKVKLAWTLICPLAVSKVILINRVKIPNPLHFPTIKHFQSD